MKIRTMIKAATLTALAVGLIGATATRAIAFPSLSYTKNIDVDERREGFRDFRIQVRGYEDLDCAFGFENITLTGYYVLFKVKRFVSGVPSDVLLALNTDDTTVTSTQVTFSVSHTNAIPNGTHYGELLLVTATTNLVRSLGQGTYEVSDSLFDDDDDTWSGPSFTNLTDYLTKTEAAATYSSTNDNSIILTNLIEGAYTEITGTGRERTIAVAGLVDRVVNDAAWLAQATTNEAQRAAISNNTANITVNGELIAANSAYTNFAAIAYGWGDWAPSNTAQGLLISTNAADIASLQTTTNQITINGELIDALEVYTNGVFLPLAGGTMTGDIIVGRTGYSGVQYRTNNSDTAYLEIYNNAGMLEVAGQDALGAPIGDYSLWYSAGDAWKVFYLNGSGVLTELDIGAAGTVLQSGGTNSAPTFAAESQTLQDVVDLGGTATNMGAVTMIGDLTMGDQTVSGKRFGSNAGYLATGSFWSALGQSAGISANGDKWAAAGYYSGNGAFGDEWTAVGRNTGVLAVHTNSHVFGGFSGYNARGNHRMYFDVYTNSPGYAEEGATNDTIFLDNDGVLYLGGGAARAENPSAGVVLRGTVSATDGSGIANLAAAELTGNAPPAALTNAIANPGATLKVASDGSAVTMGGDVAITSTSTNSAALQITCPASMVANSKVFDIDRGGSKFSVDEDGDVSAEGGLTLSGFETILIYGSSAENNAIGAGSYNVESTSGTFTFEDSTAGDDDWRFGAQSDSLIFNQKVGDSVWTERMRIDGSGNVGIDTNALLAKLHVNGAIALDDMATPTPDTSVAQFFATNSTSAEMWVMDGAGNVTQLSSHDGDRRQIAKSHNVWTGEGKTIDLWALAEAVETLTGRDDIVSDYKLPPLDWETVESNKVAAAQARRAQWVQDVATYATYTNTTLPAYKAADKAHKAKENAWNSWKRYADAYPGLQAAWLAWDGTDGSDEPEQPQPIPAAPERAGLAPVEPDQVGEPGEQPPIYKAKAMPKWLKDHKQKATP